MVSSESAVSAYENRERSANSACTVELCHGPEQALRPWTGAVSVHRGSHVTVQLFRISLEGLSLGKEI